MKNKVITMAVLTFLSLLLIGSPALAKGKGKERAPGWDRGGKRGWQSDVPPAQNKGEKGSKWGEDSDEIEKAKKEKAEKEEKLRERVKEEKKKKERVRDEERERIRQEAGEGVEGEKVRLREQEESGKEKGFLERFLEKDENTKKE